MATSNIDPEFVENASMFIEEGLRKGDAALLIATRANTDAILARATKWKQAPPGRVLAVDAVDLLQQIAAEGVPDELHFHEAVEVLIRRVAPDRGESIRVVSELPALAGRLSSVAVAAVVAELWNGLADRHRHCDFMVDFAETLKLGADSFARRPAPK